MNTNNISFLQLVEKDNESGAEIYLLSKTGYPADNIYGEQPYSDITGRYIAVRYFNHDYEPESLSVIDIYTGEHRNIIEGHIRFPAFHSWSEFIYYKQEIKGMLLLRRCRYDSDSPEDISLIPREMGILSYGTVSSDHSYYAVSIRNGKKGTAKVFSLNLHAGTWKQIFEKDGYLSQHEQFSNDGKNKVLIQLNRLPDIKQVLLVELDMEGRAKPFPADLPFTPRPTGHEAWIGQSGRILFGTDYDTGKQGCLWAGAAGEPQPELLCKAPQCFGHVSVSRCGIYWVADTAEENYPIYIGKFGSKTFKRLVLSRTVQNKNQWSHTHPYLTADNRWLIFTSTRAGYPGVYGARLANGWLSGI